MSHRVLNLGVALTLVVSSVAGHPAQASSFWCSIWEPIPMKFLCEETRESASSESTPLSPTLEGASVGAEDRAQVLHTVTDPMEWFGAEVESDTHTEAQ